MQPWQLSQNNFRHGRLFGMEIMKILKQAWVVAIILVLVSLGGYLYYEKRTQSRRQAPAPDFKLGRGSISTMPPISINHSIVPQEVTRACLECHPQAATDFMKTAHWQWVGPEEKIPGRTGTRTHRQAQSAQQFLS